jgi:acyl-CoA synthetase (NDP forming)
VSDLSALARAILGVAETVAPIVPGATDDLAVAGAKAALNLIDRFREVSNASAEELAAARDAIEARIVGELRGEADALRG